MRGHPVGFSARMRAAPAAIAAPESAPGGTGRHSAAERRRHQCRHASGPVRIRRPTPAASSAPMPVRRVALQRPNAGGNGGIPAPRWRRPRWPVVRLAPRFPRHRRVERRPQRIAFPKGCSVRVRVRPAGWNPASAGGGRGVLALNRPRQRVVGGGRHRTSGDRTNVGHGAAQQPMSASGAIPPTSTSATSTSATASTTPTTARPGSPSARTGATTSARASAVDITTSSRIPSIAEGSSRAATTITAAGRLVARTTPGAPSPGRAFGTFLGGPG